jgi:hypothetical protein
MVRYGTCAAKQSVTLRTRGVEDKPAGTLVRGGILLVERTIMRSDSTELDQTPRIDPTPDPPSRLRRNPPTRPIYLPPQIQMFFAIF